MLPHCSSVGFFWYPWKNELPQQCCYRKKYHLLPRFVTQNAGCSVLNSTVSSNSLFNVRGGRADTHVLYLTMDLYSKGYCIHKLKHSPLKSVFFLFIQTVKMITLHLVLICSAVTALGTVNLACWHQDTMAEQKTTLLSALKCFVKGFPQFSS